MNEVTRPRLEGTIAVRGDRRLGFAEFGSPHGPAIIWMHGTPGARRQIPVEARAYADREGLRIIGIDRPGIGSSTPHVYESIIDWSADLEMVADTLGIDTMRLIGLSGGGPYVLGAAAALSDRVLGVAVLGGVPPTRGPDAPAGGLVSLAARLEPLVSVGRVPLGLALTIGIRLMTPLAGPALDLYARVQPPGDRELLSRPEFKAMFVDDLLNGSRKQVTAPLSDLILFSRHWGFEASDVRVPVRWWHGDDDHIVPHRHGEHMVRLLPDAVLRTIEGESHLSGLGLAEEILATLMGLEHPRSDARTR
ncbi:MAG TPA: alpha/beta hydrolase [Nocardioidaceae bacterium]|jgi:pimeloyl-ACP methyl ester carboxylesterase|nr:alpha/beta hydrolase [Nocardioidaceae bacterium]